jgi:hypothetical protein
MTQPSGTEQFPTLPPQESFGALGVKTPPEAPETTPEISPVNGTETTQSTPESTTDKRHVITLDELDQAIDAAGNQAETTVGNGKKIVAVIAGAAVALTAAGVGVWAALRPKEGFSTDPNRPIPGSAAPVVPGPNTAQPSAVTSGQPTTSASPEATSNPEAQTGRFAWLSDPELDLSKNPNNAGVEGLTAETFVYAVDGKKMSLQEFTEWAAISTTEYPTVREANAAFFEKLNALNKSILEFGPREYDARIWPTNTTDVGGDMGYGAAYYQNLVFFDHTFNKPMADIAHTSPLIMNTNGEASLIGFMQHAASNYQTVSFGQEKGQVANTTPYSAEFKVLKVTGIQGARVISEGEYGDNLGNYPEKGGDDGNEVKTTQFAIDFVKSDDGKQWEVQKLTGEWADK